jgi:hypothetical protein
VYGSYDLEPFGGASDRMLIVARPVPDQP